MKDSYYYYGDLNLLNEVLDLTRAYPVYFMSGPVGLDIENNTITAASVKDTVGYNVHRDSKDVLFESLKELLVDFPEEFSAVYLYSADVVTTIREDSLAVKEVIHRFVLLG